MPIARSIHIGVNRSDLAEGVGVMPLQAAEADALVMDALARDAGFPDGARTLLLGDDATVAATRVAIGEAIDAIGDEGFLLLSFAGHGVTGRGAGLADERFDQAMVLADGIHCDDCLADLLSGASSSARILLVLDCCYARGMAMVIAPPPFVTRSLPAAASDALTSEALDELITRSCGDCGTADDIKASTLVLAACAVLFESGEHSSQGFFTQALARAVRAGVPNYAELHARVANELHSERMPAPEFGFFGGRMNDTFWNSAPLVPI